MRRKTTSILFFVFLFGFISMSLLFLRQSGNMKSMGTELAPRNDQNIQRGEKNKNLCPTTRTKTLTEDLLCMEPPTFLKEYKNPCWLREWTHRLQCLPYFQLIGMDKCGSSDFFNRLTKHPDILNNTGVLSKETWWWSWKRYGLDFDRKKSKKLNMQSYIKFFDKAASKIENVAYSNHKNFITGDGTPMDMWDFRGWQQIPQNEGLKVPRILTPHLMYHVNPQVKLIIILRNPVDRLYSDYFFISQHTNRKTPETFHEAVIKSIQVLKDCLVYSSMMGCLNSESMHSKWNHLTRLNIGLYSIYMKEWLSVFPREQFFIIRTEDYSKDLYTSMKHTFQFLGVRDLPENEMDKLAITSTNHYRITTNKHAAGPMLNTTRRLLTEFYKPFNEHLAVILKDESFKWLDV